MTTIGYIWVGPLDHNAEFQRDLLRRRGAETIFEDISANSSAQTRPQLTATLDRIAPGDTLVIWRLDRLASSVSGVLGLLELLGGRNVGVTSIAEDLDTRGSTGEPVLKFIAAVNELERLLLREHTLAGVYAARARGRVAGRPRALSGTNVERVIAMRTQGATIREIAQELGTSRATIYRALESHEAGGAQSDSEPSGVGGSAPARARSRGTGEADPLTLGSI